jgi:hypothetical protein
VNALFFQQSCPVGWCYIEGGRIYLSKQAIASFIYPTWMANSSARTALTRVGG